MEQAGARAPVINAVGAGAQKKRFLQCVQRAIDRASRCEGAVIGAGAFLRAAMFLQLRRLVVIGDQNEGK